MAEVSDRKTLAGKTPTERTENWKIQIRKGYLELCILAVIRHHKRIYGLELIDRLSQAEIEVKEGTLYPLLNRLTEDGVLSASWETENVKGHPRKFYSLTKDGVGLLASMHKEFDCMVEILKNLED